MSRENESVGACAPQVGSGRSVSGVLLSTRDLTVCYGSNEAMGTVHNDVLWSLALLLLAMSLVFIMIIHLIGHKGAAKRG